MDAVPEWVQFLPEWDVLFDNHDLFGQERS